MRFDVLSPSARPPSSHTRGVGGAPVQACMCLAGPGRERRLIASASCGPPPPPLPPEGQTPQNRLSSHRQEPQTQ